MTKKTWIKVKRGLLTDPRHRRTLGARIWLYLHIIDRANWDKGAVLEWRDVDEADALDMPVRTLREQRKQLQADGYITCNQAQHSQQIVIHKWVNPRSYSGKVLNQGDKKPLPSKSQGDAQGDAQGSSKHVTPSLSSHDHRSEEHTAQKPRDLLFDAISEVCQVDPATTGASIGKVKKALLKADPPYTPDEVRAFSRWHNSDQWRKDKGPPSLWALKEKIGLVRKPENSNDTHKTVSPKRFAEMKKRHEEKAQL